MASGVLLNITEEATCPICLDLLKTPMCLDCGHSFCQACITTNNRLSMMGQEGESHCPVCRLSYQPGNLRPNVHLSNIVERLRKVKCSPEKDQKRDLCVRHGEKLLLFCKEEEKIICWLCERSQEHRGHHTFLMEEVAQEYKEYLQEGLKSLKAEQQKAEQMGADLEKQRTSWRDLIENDRQSIQDSFKKLREFVDSEEQKMLKMLKEEETDVLNDLAQTECELVQQSQLLKNLISDLENRLQGSTLEMMQDVNSIMKRIKTFTLMKPKNVSKIQGRVFQAPDLNGMLQVFHGLTDAQRYWGKEKSQYYEATLSSSFRILHFLLGLMCSDPCFPPQYTHTYYTPAAFYCSSRTKLSSSQFPTHFILKITYNVINEGTSYSLTNPVFFLQFL
uniref:Tripartite motif containing 5 n=1 Tax=Molossus molossus TaxID=27622 RepID=A0A7J8EV64_MOLMO|nr:tripartite motif containing 5 [Molossus molossus]